jgi:putative PIG3 family NAD(P)H quinone oxidoreductase
MRAAVVTQPGGPEVFAVRELPDPGFAADEVLVAVHACGVCRPDLGMREGRTATAPAGAAVIPGMEIAGTIEAAGAAVEGWHVGDRVMARTAGGGYGSKLAVHGGLLVPIPSTLDFEQAAAVPDAFYTAFDALFSQAGLQPGESVLIHAVGSGVGTAAVQLAAAAGCRVFGTARSDDKLARARALGVDVAINATEQDFAHVIAEETGGAGVDVILDLVGGSYWPSNLRSVATLGRLMVIGTLGGTAVETDLRLLMGRRLRIFGTNLMRRTLDERAALARVVRQQVVPLLERRAVAPVVDRVYPLAEVADAHRRMESNAVFGKLVVSHDR